MVCHTSGISIDLYLVHNLCCGILKDFSARSVDMKPVYYWHSHVIGSPTAINCKWWGVLCTDKYSTLLLSYCISWQHHSPVTNNTFKWDISWFHWVSGILWQLKSTNVWVIQQTNRPDESVMEQKIVYVSSGNFRVATIVPFGPWPLVGAKGLINQ